MWSSLAQVFMQAMAPQISLEATGALGDSDDEWDKGMGRARPG